MFWNDQIKFNVKKTVHEFQIEIEIIWNFKFVKFLRVDFCEQN